ncbi:AMP-binding protein [Streptomyces sp. 796.1]|uniref:AMP-binding protein n=1 Tax=Streptomyces sp. 796.1 TaxID=3163029 RepID=UPI0039C9ED7F
MASLQLLHPCLHQQFEAVAGRYPQRIAVTSAQQSLSYAELNAKADLLAEVLRAHGVRPDTRVALYVPRGIGAVVGMVGILKAGGAYVPVDPGHPPRRVRWMIRDSACLAVVTVGEFSGPLSRIAPAVVDLNPLLAGMATDPATGAGGETETAAENSTDFRPESPTEFPPGSLPLDVWGNAWPDHRAQWSLPPTRRQRPTARSVDTHLAYAIYTSGTTGRPQGVAVEHRSVVHLFRRAQPWFGFTQDDVWAQFHSAGFDFSVWEIWGALLHGGRLVVVPFDVARSPAALHALLRAQRVTVLGQTPGAFRRLAAADAEASEPLSALRLVVIGGDVLHPRTLRPWWERYGDQRPRLVNMYGVTEATVHASYRPLFRTDLAATGPVASPIGTPLPGLAFHLRDADGEPVSAGTPGELHIEGPALARGYLGCPDLTQARFRVEPGPWGVRRLYRTGDLAIECGDGQYGYLGRTDEQIKVGGVRVEPGEVESLLVGHPAVEQAVVLPREREDGDALLIAYVAVAAPYDEGVARRLPGELAALAAAELPAALRPARYVPLAALPLTARGKVDRAELAARADPVPGADGGPLADVRPLPRADRARRPGTGSG